MTKPRVRAVFLGVVAGVALGMACYRASASEAPAAAAQPAATAPADPWAQIQQFHDKMDQLFAREFGQEGAVNNHAPFTVPNMDLSDAKDHYEVTMDMPGADQKSIKVAVHGRQLAVSGSRSTSETMNNGRILRSERSEAGFERVVRLPGPVDVAALTSHYADGVLTINVPKARENVAAAQKPGAEKPAAPPAGAPWIGASPGTWPASSWSAGAWDQLDQFHNSMDQLFNDTFDQAVLNPSPGNGQIYAVPTMDIADRKDRYEVTMDMPGVDKGKIDVNVQGDQLTVSAQRAIGGQPKPDAKALRTERGTAEFVRSVTLPGPVQTSAVKAKYDNGILTIDLPKAANTAAPVSVTVQ